MEAPEKKTFKIDLFQSHWMRSNTESFTEEFEDEAAAKEWADNLAEEKGLTENFDFEITDITPVPIAEDAEEETSSDVE